MESVLVWIGDNVKVVEHSFVFVLGLLLLLFNKPISKATVELNYKIFGIRFSEKWYRISFIFGGVFCLCVLVSDILG